MRQVHQVTDSRNLGRGQIAKSVKTNKNMSTGGFTLIETMIVLALTGLVAVIIFNYVSGLLGNSEFTTAANSAAKSIGTVINQTANGSYLNNGKFSCAAGQNGSPPVISAVTGSGQGTNLGCILLGNLVQFSPNGNANSYSTYPVAGLEYGGVNGGDSTTIAQAMPVSINEASSTGSFKYSLNVASVTVKNPGGQMVPASIVGLLDSDDTGNLGNVNTVTGTTDSGTAGLSLYYVTSGYDPTSDSPIPTANLLSTSEIDICVTNGSNSGLITIGGSDGGTGVTLQVYGGSSC
jgi:prepilin-type N-terminal cleavage/methylation domain-containing protein